MNKVRVAIIGSGNIGTDLLFKSLRSDCLNCTLFIGRNSNSKGINIAKQFNICTSIDGVNTLIEAKDDYDMVFDCTSATAHFSHAPVFKELKKKVIDLTPSVFGFFCVPSINLDQSIKMDNISLISCGSQASLPLLYALFLTQIKMEYIEVVTSISSKSAGFATRENIDEYLTATEDAIKEFTNCKTTKVILILNPAIPEVKMKTTIYVILDAPHIEIIKNVVSTMVLKVQQYVPGYKLLVQPILEKID